jgi:hypothetical protein
MKELLLGGRTEEHRPVGRLGLNVFLGARAP